MRLGDLRGVSLLLLAASLSLCPCEADFRSQKWAASFKALAGADDGILPFEEDNSEPEHVRRRRAVYASFGVSLSCGPGWTGIYCENPICSEKNTAISTSSSTQIEFLYLGSGCTGDVVIPIDSSVSGSFIMFTVNVDDGHPNITIVDSSGNIALPSTVAQEPGSTHALFSTMTPGLYSLTIDTAGVPTAFCSLTVDAHQSSLQFATGFVASPNSDFPSNAEAGVSGEPMYFVLHSANIASPGTAAVLTIRELYSSELQYRALLQKRYNCGFEQYAGQFTCQHTSRYAYVIEGTDASGFAFRRSGSFSCLVAPSTTPSLATTLPPPDVCMNGGTLLYYGTSESRCLCAEYFTGSRCEQVLCMNGGQQNPEKSGCICEEGFEDINCQTVRCTDHSGQGMLSEYKTLIVVVRATSSMAPYINDIAKAINDLITQYEVREIQPYHSYLLVTFANNDVQFQYFFGTDSTKFLASLSSLNSSDIVSYNCTDSVFTALSVVYSQIIYNKSPIYLFTDVAPNDANLLTILHMNAGPKFPIYFFLLNGTSAQCTVDPLSPTVRAMNSVAQYTGGLLMTPRVSRTSFVYGMIAQITSYMVNNVLMNDYVHCSMKGYSTFFVDPDAQALYILATGVGLTLTVTDPQWKQAQAMLVLNEADTYLWEIVQPAVGEYLFVLQSTNTYAQCSYRILAQSKYDLFYASTSSLTIDAPFTEPVYQSSSHMVAHLNGLVNVTDQFRLFAEMTISSTDEDGNVVPLYYSSGTFRKNCGYQLYFGIFSCQTADQILYITVYADDPNGNTIQRTAVGFCSYIQPTPTSIGTCQNGGVVNPSNTSQCICYPDFTGDYCEQIVCQNGGTELYGTCVCPPGTTSRFCETNTCIERSADVGFDPEGRSLAFVLSVSGTMKEALQKVADEASEFVRDIQAASPSWISRYIVVVFNETDAFLLQNTTDPLLFVQELQTVALNWANTDPAYQGSCLTRAESGVYLAVMASLLNSYVFVFTDSAAVSESQIYLLALTKLEDLQAEVSFVSVSESVCGTANGRFSDRISSLAYFTDGDLYYTSEVANVMRFIVSFYSSGVVLEKESATCSQEALIAYIPVDSWTEAFTISVTGWNAQISVTLPDGSLGLNDPTEVPLIAGGVNKELNILQHIAPCDNVMWSSWQSHCYLLDPTMAGWKNASDFCRNDEGAFLIDIYTQEKQNYIFGITGTTPYWIGLSRIGDTQEWQWEVPEGNQPSKLLPTSYNNWAQGEPSTDTTKSCVIVRYVGSTPFWYAEDCEVLSYRICQKHRYGQGFSPSVAMENPLPSGIWKAEIKTDNESCSVQVRIQSKIQVYYGFTTDVHSDKPLLYGNSLSNSNRLIARTTGLEEINPGVATSFEGSLNYAYLSTGTALWEAVTLQPRPIDECAYTAVSQDFSCPASTQTIVQFVIKFSGVDQLGNLFERTVGAYCMPTTRGCLNGGTFVNGVCICPQYFTGSECGDRLCLNGGVVLPNGYCNCPASFTGGSCENPVCQPKYPANFTDDGRTLAILLETSFGTTSTIYVLGKGLVSTLTTILSGPTANWFSTFMLVPFDSSSNEQDWYPTVVTNNIADLQTALNSIPLGQCPGDKVCESGDKCPRPIISVLNRTMSHPQFASPNSVVFIITRSGVADYLEMEAATLLIQAKHAQVNVVLPDIASPCGNGFEQPSSAALYSLVAFSGGNVFLTTAREVIDSLFSFYLLSVYQSSSIDFAFARNCTYEESYIQVDRGASEISIDYNGFNPSLQLFGPNGMQVTLPGSIITSDSNYLGILILDTSSDQHVGTYKLVSKSDDQSCALNVRMRSTIETFVGFTQPTDGHNGATRDDAHYGPINGQSNIVIAHAKNLGTGRLSYVQLWSQSGILFVSEMLPRADCSYEYYSSKSFTCTLRSFIVALYGIDDHGNNFKRAFLAHCVDSRPSSLELLN